MQISSDTYFTYDGHQSYLYGLRFAWIEDSPEKVMVSEKKYSQIKNNTQNYFRVAKSEYDDPLEFDAMMSSDRVLFDAEVRRIYNKFFDKNQYKVLSLPVNGENIFFNCIFTNVEKIEGGYDDKYGVVGFKLKIICDAPWGWTEKKTVTPIIEPTAGVSTSGKFIIRNRSDGQDFIYPEMYIAIPTSPNAEESTRIGNEYSCLGCPVLDVCRYGNSYFPSYMSDDDIGTYISENTGNALKKAMIINTSDDQLRGCCIFCNPTEQQIIHMEPKIGAITGVSSDVSSSDSIPLATRYYPFSVGTVDIGSTGYADLVSNLIDVANNGAGVSIPPGDYLLTVKDISGENGSQGNGYAKVVFNGDGGSTVLEKSLRKNVNHTEEIHFDSMVKNIRFYSNQSDAASSGCTGKYTSFMLTPYDGTLSSRMAQPGLVTESAIARTNKKFIRLVPGDNVFYTENLKTGDLTLIFEEARILV